MIETRQHNTTTIGGFIVKKPFEMKWKWTPVSVVVLLSMSLGAVCAHKSARLLEHLRIFIHEEDVSEDDDEW